MDARARTVAALAVAAILVAGCSRPDGWAEPRVAPTGVGALGAGFLDPSAPPSPEATLAPEPGSWSDVHPAPGYRVVLLTAGDDAPTTTLVRSVQDWADEERVALKEVVVDDGDYVGGITSAMSMHPDLIISVGDALVDPLAVVTANHLDEQFLVLGAEVAEPTHNVTAVDWTGASFRGEGLGTSSTYDAGSFTPERGASAVRAGAAAVLTGVSGVVLWID
ncbi:hypothetical protein [Cellulomonas sp. URHE0023]|uniref:hypothetical protein n=1 Tax=Cellulomonas sp. URHE0023 TaxID=1380354 RepID=UPI0004856252|nr:hypothetical protein [Cellulomonas sp. URHE0023]